MMEFDSIFDTVKGKRQKARGNSLGFGRSLNPRPKDFSSSHRASDSLIEPDKEEATNPTFLKPDLLNIWSKGVKKNTKLADTDSRISPWLSSLTYLLAGNILLPLYFSQITITGQENLPKSGPVILAPTHKARWDSLLLPYATGRYITGRDLRFMVTSTECQGFQGWFVRRLGGFPINAKRPSITTLRHTVELLLRGEMLVIYPEGGIFRDRDVHLLKPGIARLAMSAESSHPGLGVKIVPICFNYSHPYPSWGSDVSISIGSPIKVSDYAQGSIKQDAKSLTDDLYHALQQLNYQYDDLASSGFVHIES